MNCAACPDATASCADAPFERRDALFEGGGGRVHDAAVDVSESLQRKELGRVIGVLEDIRGGLVERHRAGAGGRIGSLPGVHGQGVETEDVIVFGARFAGGIGRIGDASVTRRVGVIQGDLPGKPSQRRGVGQQPVLYDCDTVRRMGELLYCANRALRKTRTGALSSS